MIFLSDFFNTVDNGDSIDSILEQVRAMRNSDTYGEYLQSSAAESDYSHYTFTPEPPPAEPAPVEPAVTEQADEDEKAKQIFFRPKVYEEKAEALPQDKPKHRIFEFANSDVPSADLSDIPSAEPEKPQETEKTVVFTPPSIVENPVPAKREDIREPEQQASAEADQSTRIIKADFGNAVEENTRIFTEQELNEEKTRFIDPFTPPLSGETEFAMFKRKNTPPRQSAMETNEYRERFMRSLNTEPVLEPDEITTGPVDRPGMIVEKHHTQYTGELQPMPKIVTADKMLEHAVEEKTFIAGKAASAPAQIEPEQDDNVEGQLLLTGFDDTPIDVLPKQQNPRDVENALWTRRREKAKNFRLISSETDESETDGISKEAEETPAPDVSVSTTASSVTDEESATYEYTSRSSRGTIYKQLTEKAKNATVAFIGTLGIEFVFILLFFIPKVFESFSVSSPLFSQGGSGVYTVSAVLLSVAAALNKNVVIDGVMSLFRLKPTAASASVVAVILALLHNIISIIAPSDVPVGAESFSAVAAFALMLNSLAVRINYQRIINNFEQIAMRKKHDLYAIHPFTDANDMFELGRGLLMGNATMLYSSKIGFPDDFVKNSTTNESEKKAVRILLPCAFAASLISATVCGIVNKDFMCAVTALVASFCMSAPVLSGLVPALISLKAANALKVYDSQIVSLDAAENFGNTNAAVIDSADIFNRSACTMHGMKDFKNVRIDDVLLYAAAMVIKSGGPLSESFETIIGGNTELLPAVKEFAFEDKLGLSARIRDQKVLLGNRNLLINHNVEVAPKSMEEKYTHHGRKVIYLSVAEKLAAMFVVSYSVDKTLSVYIHELERNGVQLLVRSNDVNITEEMLARSFGLPLNSVKVISGVAGKIFRDRRDEFTERLPVTMLHDGTALTMLRTLAWACRMFTNARLAFILQAVLCGLGCVLSTVLCCLGSVLFNPMIAVAFVILGASACAALTAISKVK